MRINIPKKLERYKDNIKEFSEQIIFSKSISLIRVGGSQKDNHYKEIYLCFNPYSTTIKLDINHFAKDKNIYKMHPQVLNIPSNEVFAFIIFASKGTQLHIDEDYILFHKKQRIAQLINQINSKNQEENLDILIEEYNPEINSTLLLDDINLIKNKSTEVSGVDFDKTQHFDDFDPRKEISDFDYVNSNSENENITVKLDKLEYGNISKKYKIIIEFINKAEEENYEVNGFTINLYDKENKHAYQIDKEIKLKCRSKKKVSFSLDKNIFEEFIIQDLKIKVSF